MKDRSGSFCHLRGGTRLIGPILATIALLAPVFVNASSAAASAPSPRIGPTVSRMIPVSEASAFLASKGLGGVRRFSSGVKCEGVICMELIGSGLHVDTWYMYFGLPRPMCTFGVYWYGSIAVAYAPDLCGNKGDIYYSEWDNQSFLRMQVLCNTRQNVAGKPCAAVQS